MLLIDGHASHITTAAMEYCVNHKVILLCLPAHTTHLLQPLDVGIFAPLATAYKNLVHDNTRYAANYLIDKTDFLELYRKAQYDAITPYNIQRAWKKAGLHPFNPQLVLQKLSPTKDVQLMNDDQQLYNITIRHRPTTPPEATVTYSNGRIVALTPANTAQFQQILDRAVRAK